jgi:hypothetical protein
MFLKSKIILLAVMLMVVGCASVLRAQSEDKEKTEQEAAKQKELEKNALKLLDEAIGGGGGLKLRENRTYVLSVAADALWPYDEKRARSLFWEALGALNLQPYQEVGQSVTKETNIASAPARTNGPSKEQLEELNKFYARLNLRNDFLHKVARHDPQLALDMLRSTRSGSPPNIPGITRFDPDAQMEQELLIAAAANDPKRALQLARESLAKGSTYQVLNLLREINQKDQDLGAQLAGDIIAKLQTENLAAPNSYAPYMVIDLLASSRENGAVLGAMYEGESPPPLTRLKLDEHQKQDLVYLLTDAALSASGGNTLQAIRSIMPEIEQYAPDRMPKLKAKLTASDSSLPPNVREWNMFNAKFEKASAEEMIKAAGQVDEDQRRALFFQAASKAVAGGDTDRYRELLNNLNDETQRKLALDALDQQQMYDDIARGKTDDLEKLVALIRVKEQRALAMSELALMLEKKNQHDAAVKLLDEARFLVKVDLANEAQSNALLAVMFACALIDSAKAFGMIEPIVDHTNDQISKLVLVDKVMKTGAIKDGEIILNQPQMSLDYAFLKYSPGLVALGKADFDRTKALAERFQRNELKVAARLLVARAMLRAARTNQRQQ